MSIRRARSLIGLLTLLLVAVAAAGAEPAAAPTYHQEEGRQAVYRVATKSTSNQPRAGGTVKTTSTASVRVSVEFLGLTPDSTIQVRGEVLSGTVSKVSQGKTQTIALQPRTVNYEVSPRGEVKLADGDVTPTPGTEEVGITLTPDDGFLAGYLAVLPKRPLKVGDHWTGTVTSGEAGSENETEVRYDAKAVGQTQYAGRTCWKIKTNYKRALTQTFSAPDGSGEVRVKSTATGTCAWLFAPQEGVLVASDTTSKSLYTATLSVAEAEETVHGSLTSEVHARLVELDGEPVAAK